MEEKLPEQMSVESWNDVWYSRVKKLEGEGHARLMVYQTMSGYVEYEGKFYKVTGWQPPEGKAYVTSVEVDKKDVPIRPACERKTRYGIVNSCINTHKPATKDFKIGEIWTCPSCAKRWQRENNTMSNGKIAAWHWPPDDELRGTYRRDIEGTSGQKD